VKQDSARPVALVTGAARGIGLGVARELAYRGWRTHVVYRGGDPQDLEERFPARVHRADVLAVEDCRRLVREVLDYDERLDAVVHAVGEFEAGPLEGMGREDFERMLTSNATSAFLLVEAARQAIRSSRGSYVFFGCAGLESLRARSEAAAYTAAKTALLVFARSLALEEAPHGVRANIVSPGLVPHEHASEDTHARVDEVPSGRPGTVEDVAHTVSWLLSAEAGHVTGQNLDVSGGWML